MASDPTRSTVGEVNAPPPTPYPDDNTRRRIPSDRRRAGMKLADGYPESYVADQMGVSVNTIRKWADEDADFRDGFAEQTRFLNTAAERGRLKIASELDGLIDNALSVARDTGHKDYGQMSRYLIDKVIVPESKLTGKLEVDVGVTFWQQVESTVEKIREVRAKQAPQLTEGSGIPELLRGEAAADSYGARSLRVPGALDIEKPA